VQVINRIINAAILTRLDVVSKNNEEIVVTFIWRTIPGGEQIIDVIRFLIFEKPW
jgi:hypothetical protein